MIDESSACYFGAHGDCRGWAQPGPAQDGPAVRCVCSCHGPKIEEGNVSKTPDCQLCESGVKTFREEYPETPADYPKFHVVGQGITSYSVPCNALERAKMRAVNEKLAKADGQNP